MTDEYFHEELVPEKQVPRNSDNRGLDDRLCRI